MLEFGIIQADGSVLEDNGNIHHLPRRGTDEEGYPEVLMDAEEVGGSGFMFRQSVKPFIGYPVCFVRSTPNTTPFNHIVLPKESSTNEKDIQNAAG